jgi:hypothetical protein
MQSSPKIQTRLRDLNNFITRVNWVAGGGAALLALLALGSTDSSGAPQLLSSFLITFVVGAGALLAYARANFELAISKIEHEIESNPNVQRDSELTSLPEEARLWPKYAHLAWEAALVLILISIILFFLGTWWWLIDVFCWGGKL